MADPAALPVRHFLFSGGGKAKSQSSLNPFSSYSVISDSSSLIPICFVYTPSFAWWFIRSSVHSLSLPPSLNFFMLEVETWWHLPFDKTHWHGSDCKTPVTELTSRFTATQKHYYNPTHCSFNTESLVALKRTTKSAYHSPKRIHLKTFLCCSVKRKRTFVSMGRCDAHHVIATPILRWQSLLWCCFQC